MSKIIADKRARQGRRGTPVLIVLVGSLVLLAVAMIGFMTWTGRNSPTSPQQAASQQANSPGASSSNTSRVPTENPAYPAPAAPASGTPGSAPAQR